MGATFRGAGRRLAGVLAVAAFAISACSGPSHPGPPKQSKYQITTARRQQLIPLIVQCFISKHLISSGDLKVSASPPVSPSAWLHHGRVTRNTAFNNWYADKGAGLTVHGKTVDSWVTDAAYDPATWPTSICGPRPHVTPTAPAYSPPGS